MTDRTVTLTPDELDALLQDLERDHGEHDFEPECPACTGTQKLRAALAAGVMAAEAPRVVVQWGSAIGKTESMPTAGVTVDRHQTFSQHTPMDGDA